LTDIDATQLDSIADSTASIACIARIARIARIDHNAASISWESDQQHSARRVPPTLLRHIRRACPLRLRARKPRHPRQPRSRQNLAPSVLSPPSQHPKRRPAPPFRQQARNPCRGHTAWTRACGTRSGARLTPSGPPRTQRSQAWRRTATDPLTGSLEHPLMA
jgi:hypothetical protein